MTDDVFVLNRNEGTDTLHRNGGEACNLDDADDRQVVDTATANALLITGQARACAHCYPQEDPA